MRVELPLAAFGAALLVLFTSPLFWRTRNIPLLSAAAWLFIVNVVYGVNALVWSDHARDVATIYCDIATRTIIGAHFALPMCSLCTAIDLQRISTLQDLHMSCAEKRRRRIVHTILCWAFPVACLTFYHLFQFRRFSIVEGFGCWPSIGILYSSLVVIYGIPLIVSLLTCMYSGIAFVQFQRRRSMFNQYFSQFPNALSPLGHIRLLLMTLIGMSWGLLVLCAMVVENIQLGVYPSYMSFTREYRDLTTINQTILAPLGHEQRMFYLFWWPPPISALILFAFFAFSCELEKNYRAAFVWFQRVILRRAIIDDPPRIRWARHPREEAILGDIEINIALPPHSEEEPSLFEMNPLWAFIQQPLPTYPPPAYIESPTVHNTIVSK